MKPYAKKKSYGHKNKHRNEYGEKNRTRPSSFAATCAKCGSNCQVPFKPNGRKPVHCSKCFDQFGPSESIAPKSGFGRGSGRKDNMQVSNENAEVVRQLKQLNEKFDMLLDAIEELGMDS